MLLFLLLYIFQTTGLSYCRQREEGGGGGGGGGGRGRELISSINISAKNPGQTNVVAVASWSEWQN